MQVTTEQEAQLFISLCLSDAPESNILRDTIFDNLESIDWQRVIRSINRRCPETLPKVN